MSDETEADATLRWAREAAKFKRQARDLRRHLRDYVCSVNAVINLIDALMKTPESYQRGQQIARALNQLDCATDAARHFGLGESFRSIKKSKAPRGR